MSHAAGSLRRALTWAHLGPAVRTGLWVVALFGAGLWLAGHYATPIHDVLDAHARLGLVVFVASSAVAVLLPMLTNLPLLPFAVLAWGPGWSALLLLVGWIIGAALSFSLGRGARGLVLRHFPSVQRHANIDRLIHPRHRLLSLVLLRMTFPVDVLSYALGLFSRHTSLADNLLSTAIGAAPFALLFAWFPTWSTAAQTAVFTVSALAFASYTAWIVRRPA
jgi:uncharacterized membrane protein YdjX (TVP38/TMEM64 family)